jgi:predicted GIY-YIG superfamily endonuclease
VFIRKALTMVYLIHFDKPFGHAQHYIGYTDNLKRRMHDHELGTRGAKLLKAVREAGINFAVVRTWPEGDRTFERKLHNYKKSSCLCPVCQEEKLRIKNGLSILSKPRKKLHKLPERSCPAHC